MTKQQKIKKKHWQAKNKKLDQECRKEIRKMKRLISKKSGLTSQKILEESGIMREKRCRILRTLAKDMKATKVTPLSKNHKEKCIRWSKKMKTDFSTVIFSDKYRATLDGAYDSEDVSFREIGNQHNLQEVKLQSL